MTTSNVSTISLDVIYNPAANAPVINLSSFGNEVIYTSDPLSLNLTSLSLDAIYEPIPILNVTATRIEVMYQVTYDNVAAERIQLSYMPNTLYNNVITSAGRSQLSYSADPDANVAAVRMQIMYQITSQLFGSVTGESLYSSGDNTNTSVNSVSSEVLYGTGSTNVVTGTVTTEVLICMQRPNPRRKPIYLVTSR